jgi:hypothetical protein
MRKRVKDLDSVKGVALGFMETIKGDISQGDIDEWDNLDMQVESDLDSSNLMDDVIQVVLLEKGLVSVYVEQSELEYYGSCYFKLNGDSWELTDKPKG